MCRTRRRRFAICLRAASPQAIERAKAVLRGEDTVSLYRRPPVDRVALIGLRGAGKSTLGRLAAKRLRWKFIELNREVEHESGFSMAEIFRLYGQEGYRRLELDALRKISARREPMILATGGGIVSEPATFELLVSSFFTIWLRASPEEHMARVRQQGDLRPMANERAAMDDLRTILSTREPFYARADAVVDTSGAFGRQRRERDLVGHRIRLRTRPPSRRRACKPNARSPVATAKAKKSR